MGVLRVPWDGVDMVAQASCFLLVAVVSCSLAEQGLPSSSRQSRSLVGTFPFNSPDLSLPERKTRQGGDGGVATDFQSVAAAGQRCIDKITTEEETEYDEVVTCDHSYNTRCHTSYKTSYNAQQEEECDENYKKNCFIEYYKTATKAEVQICVEPLVKNCDIPGPEVCSTEYQSECETKQEVHDVEDDQVSCQTVIEEKCEDETSGYTTDTKCSKWPKEVCSVAKTPVTKFTPITRCDKVPVEICGPSGCGVTKGPKECRTETRTIPGEKPEEQCSLEPQKKCQHVTKLVPELKPHESCLDVPKEVCTRSQSNPRKVQKPVITKWCYHPSEEAGIPEGSGSSKPQGQKKPQQRGPFRNHPAGAHQPVNGTTRMASVHQNAAFLNVHHVPLRLHPNVHPPASGISRITSANLSVLLMSALHVMHLLQHHSVPPLASGTSGTTSASLSAMLMSVLHAVNLLPHQHQSQHAPQHVKEITEMVNVHMNVMFQNVHPAPHQLVHLLLRSVLQLA